MDNDNIKLNSLSNLWLKACATCSDKFLVIINYYDLYILFNCFN